MKVDRIVRSSLRVLLFLAAAASLPAYPQPQTPQQPVAGKITALIPTGSVLRETKTYEAKKDMGVFWQDTVKTERGGRARLRLEDGSILNVGSQASLVVTKHDPGKQQTDLELIYGKVRADVTKIATPDGHFEIRTKVAVCGVVGTEEYLEATDLATTVIALGGGQVRVSSADPRFPGATLLNPGEAISIIAGRAPGSKRLASAEEMQRAVFPQPGGAHCKDPRQYHCHPNSGDHLGRRRCARGRLLAYDRPTSRPCGGRVRGRLSAGHPNVAGWRGRLNSAATEPGLHSYARRKSSSRCLQGADSRRNSDRCLPVERAQHGAGRKRHEFFGEHQLSTARELQRATDGGE